MDSRSSLRIAKKHARPVLAFFFGLMLFAVVPGSPALQLNAQESQPSAGDAARPAAEAPSQEFAKDEAKASDPTEALRHSSAVCWIARKTGLSVDQVYWLSFLTNFGIIFVALAWPLWKR